MWLIFSDAHLKEWKAFSTTLSNGLNSRLMEQIKVLQQVKKIARQHKVSTIFFLGDLVDSISPMISKIIINTAFYMIQSLAEVASIYLLVGNHDVFGQINTLTPFSSIPQVKIIDESISISLDGKTIDLIPCYGTWPKSKSNYCFGHFGIEGATIGDGFVATEEIKPQLLKDYKLVLAGHYHTRQMVANNAYQTGSVMDMNFSNTPEDKGIFLLNPEKDELKFTPIKSPKFYTVKCASSDQIEEFLRVQYNNYDYFKLILESDSLLAPELKNNMIVKYDFEPTIIEKELIDTSQITNLVPIIQEYIHQSNTSLDKEILIKKAIELLEV